MGTIRFVFAVMVLASVEMAAGAALAVEQRIALIIGNSAYATAPLANPVNDARLMSRVLREQGFDVIERLDVGQNDMKRAVKDFGNRLKAAQGEAIGLFYYAGHGLQVRGENFLIPIDAEIEDEGDVDIYAISADAVLRTIEDARNGLNIIILDACRNNPYARSFRAATRGLAMMSAPTGTLIAYSTAPGAVALDGDGANSAYTAALARAIAEPGVPVEKLFKSVRDAVLAETQGRQTPWEASSLTGADFYFAAAAESVVAPTPPPSPATDDRAFELAFWESIKNSRRPEDFEDYLARFANGTFAGLAQRSLDELRGETEVAVVTPPPEPEIAVEPLDSLMVAVRNANVRRGHSTDFDQVARLSAGEEVTVTGKVVGHDWFRVALAGGDTGYVWAPLLGEPQQQLVALVPPPQPGRYSGPSISWRAQSAFRDGGAMFGFGPAIERFSLRLDTLSNGKFVVQTFEPGKIVPTFEIPAAIRSAEIDAAWTAPPYLYRENEAFGLLGGPPFGPSPESFIEWLNNGNGQAHYDTLFGRYAGAKALVCAMAGASGDFWINKELRSRDDLSLVKIRAFGLSVEVMAEVGALPTLLPGGEIIHAFEAGVIDAFNFLGPAADFDLGYHEVADNYYVSGILEPAGPIVFLVDKRIWDNLPARARVFVTQVCAENLHHSLSEYVRMNELALTNIRAANVHVAPLPADVIAAMRQAWQRIVEEKSAESPEFRDVYASMRPYSQ